MSRTLGPSWSDDDFCVYNGSENGRTVDVYVSGILDFLPNWFLGFMGRDTYVISGVSSPIYAYMLIWDCE